KREFQLYWDIESDLDASGELVDSKAVDAASQQLVTRGPDGAVTSATSDAETVSGYYLVDVADAARAAEIAARFPEAAVSGGGVRVTRVWTQEDFDATT
ncbi:MAG TPA: YciI family protein, partial [Microbacterium sp.]|nr:YciI family protein [Microbacterium sp.]